MYNSYMAVTATQLRKELFQTLDRVVGGQTVEVSYKGYLLQIVSLANASKLSRAVKRDILMVDPQSIVESELQDETEAGRRKGGRRL